MQEVSSPESSGSIGLSVKTGGVRVAGVFSCVPKQAILNDHYESIFGATAVADVDNMIGVHQRRLAPLCVTGVDLTFAAAEKLLGALDWSPQSVGAIIYVSQTPNYILPANRVSGNVQFFGNISFAFIPLLISTEFRGKLKDKNLKLLLAAFGVGYSWASAIIDIDANFILGLPEI